MELTGFNPKQFKAVEAPSGPLLIVAGAGTGKTKTLTGRLLHLIKSGVPAGQICALTFTNKAAKEMEHRLEMHVANSLSKSGGNRSYAISAKPFVGTFHSLGAKILRSEAKQFGRTRGFTIFDNHDSFSLLKKVLRQFPQVKELKEGPAFFMDSISKIKNGMANLAQFTNSPRVAQCLVPEILKRYELRLKENNAFDFDDLIEKVVKLLSSDKKTREKYERAYPWMLVDEYQDINNSQYELIKLLAEKTQTLSVVGDDQQTIYTWRGSNFGFFLNFERDWRNAQIVVLDQNYRSTGNILSAASAVVSVNKNQRPKKLWTEKGGGDPIALVEAGDEDEEASWIVEEAQKIAAEHPGESIAILYRTNAQSRALEQELIRSELSYRIFGGLAFYERREIKDVLAALRYALNPQDEMANDRLSKTFSQRVNAELRTRLASAGQNQIQLIDVFIKSTNYLEYLERNFPNPEERRENIEELVHFASGFAELQTFLEAMSLLQATDNIKKDGHGVELMTIHLAKGLEFDHVFVAGAVEGLLPHARSLETEDELEEERRLLYVAMTRARKNLYISFFGLPSRFLSEIPSEFVKFRNLVSDTEVFSDDEERYITLD